MTLGVTPRQAGLFRGTAACCEGRVAPDSIYGILHRECFGLFPDEMFADLFDDAGRRSVPPMIVAVVMVLQRIEGCSDREAADRFAFDARWKYAAGGLDFDYPGFAHTVLVDMRARLARSARPGRIFEVTLDAARAAGLVGRRRVLDSTPLYDAVATMDTVTLVRSAIRGLLRAGDGEPGRRAAAACCAAMMTTPPRASRPVITTTRRPGRRWSMRWPATPGRCWGHWTGGSRAGTGAGCGAAGQRDWPGPGAGRGRGVPDSPAGRPGPGHLHRRP